MNGKVTEMSVSDLVPYDRNPRVNEEAVDVVANSIRDFGFRNPILVDKDKVVIAGHTRLLAAKRLGLKKVPVMVCSDMTPEQVRAYRLADNKTAEKSGWDFELLSDELKGLEDAFDMCDYGFDEEFVAAMDECEDAVGVEAPVERDGPSNYGCTVVARFETEEDADALVRELESAGVECFKR